MTPIQRFGSPRVRRSIPRKEFRALPPPEALQAAEDPDCDSEKISSDRKMIFELDVNCRLINFMYPFSLLIVELENSRRRLRYIFEVPDGTPTKPARDPHLPDTGGVV